MNNEKIEEMIDALNADGYEEGEPWKGFHVYIPKYNGTPAVGLPYVILAKNDEIRISTDEESMEYLDFCAETDSERERGKLNGIYDN